MLFVFTEINKCDCGHVGDQFSVLSQHSVIQHVNVITASLFFISANLILHCSQINFQYCSNLLIEKDNQKSILKRLIHPHPNLWKQDSMKVLQLTWLKLLLAMKNPAPQIHCLNLFICSREVENVRTLLTT